MTALHCLFLAERHLAAAHQAAHQAANDPKDFQADLAARVHAHRALQQANQVQAALTSPPVSGLIIRTRR